MDTVSLLQHATNMDRAIKLKWQSRAGKRVPIAVWSCKKSMYYARFLSTVLLYRFGHLVVWCSLFFRHVFNHFKGHRSNVVSLRTTLHIKVKASRHQSENISYSQTDVVKVLRSSI